jgi:hypothetical protein
MVDQTEFYSTSGDKPEDHWFTGTLATIRAAGTGIGGKLSMVEFVHPGRVRHPAARPSQRRRDVLHHRRRSRRLLR